MRTRRPAAAIGLIIVLVLAGCAGGGAAPAPTTPAAPRVSIIDPDAAFNPTKLTDWKNYGDAVVAVRVTGEREAPATRPSVARGLVGRVADLRITHIFWVRDARHRPPHTVAAAVWGWTGADRTPVAARGDPRIVPGHDYLVVLARFTDGWGLLGGGGEAPFDDGIVGHGEWLGRDNRAQQDDAQRPAIDTLLGKDSAGVQRVVDTVGPNAASVRYADLEPYARAHQIALAGQR